MILNSHFYFVYLCMTKQQKTTYKPTRVIDGYQMKKHLHGGFKIIEYYHYSNEDFMRKKIIFKHLTLSEAEDKLYRLETKTK